MFWIFCTPIKTPQNNLLIRSVVAGAIELDHRAQRRRAPLPVDDIRPQHQRGRARDHVVDLADMVMLGDGIRCRLFQPAAMHHADADMRLADVDIAHLLVEQFFRDGLFRITFEFGGRDIGAGAQCRSAAGRWD